MAKLYVDTIEPEGATTNLAIGESGQDVIVTGNDIRANVLQDAGGNAIFTSNGSGTLSGVNAGLGTPLSLLDTQTASDSASVTFTSSIDSTYKEYIWRFYVINPATDGATFHFQVSIDGGSNYNVAMTTTVFEAYNIQSGTSSGLAYDATRDQGGGTAYQMLGYNLGNDATANTAGSLHIFNPASTTYAKQFYAQTSAVELTPYNTTDYNAGYINTTSAINAISFKMSSGNFDGKIKMYGVA